jgi:hypothetical protein
VTARLVFGLPNPKLTFPEARAKLFDEMRHYRGDKPPIGAFISQLILKCPTKLWKEVRESMDVRYEDW